MDTQQIIAIVVVAVIAIALIVAGVLADRSRKKRIDAAEQAREDREAAAKAAADKAIAAKQAAGSEAGSAAGTASTPSDQKSGAESAESMKQAESAQSAASSTESAGSAQSAQPESQTSQTAESQPQTPESATSRMTRLKARLANSANPFGKALFNILAKDHLSEADWEDVEDTLLMADVGADASEQLVDELRNDARITGTHDPAQVREALRSKLLAMVGTDTDRRLNADKPEAHKPSVIIMVGVNGTGKTTTAGKLARLFVADGKSVMLGAADTFRAAAADQLETWGAKVNVPVVRSDKDGADPASVAFEASQRAKNDNADVLIIDTAGRLQNKANLMDELGKIRRVTEKNLPVDEVLLVLDATTGQNGMEQAKVFAQAIGITGVVLSKLDGSAKGGIVISVQKELGVPVKLVGLGEGPDDLAPFNPEDFVDGILA
ncbi:signal recognition particle-docking protein FtsY [Bifidobacterium thermophilum]|uniref:Signal recognition particle receptor FtsY n=1 Tax=Bifidobacterium thermophilum RBL67 TaxID=1254439 RepID=M4RAM1_9BIFI|nr:signal recognition particle-docking protein FtsY [Bifidobacterium thermophilum]AGH40465.1 signal recognition particle-docking protein FtsY [Bifidobacterium thermophilum RBL67]MDW8487014.1 signal recognition particle-docking protein FtsY [Bifidobacterium thermophilum]